MTQAARHRILLVVLALLGLGCVSYTGTAKNVAPSTLSADGGWVILPAFPLVLQRQHDDCGAAVLSAVLRYWQRPLPRLAGGRRLRAGEVRDLAEQSGLSAHVFFGNMNDILYELNRGRPVIVALGKPHGRNEIALHYEVVVGYEPRTHRLLLLDPARGWQTDSFQGFAHEWAATRAVTIVAFERATERAGG